MIGPNYISYKDPAARVINKDSGYYRYIFEEYKQEYDHLMQSGLYKELTQKGLLIEHQEVELDTNDPKAYKLLYPTQISFQSYPFEWSFSQWKKAINAYLYINQIALKYGMILKDATPFNFYFTGGKAIMFDTSSFIFFNNKDKWIAYQQFCIEFLGPIALMHYNGQRWSRITKTHLKGLPLQFISKQLPLKSWFNLNTLLHIHLHAKYISKKTSKGSTNNIGFSKEKISALINMIHSSLKKWKGAFLFDNQWIDYYKNEIESKSYLFHKEQVITNWLNDLSPNSVVDLGANTGKFSFIAGKIAKKVIALESEDACIDNIENRIEKENLGNLYAAVMDLVDSTANKGALNKEFKSIDRRAQCELVLALALVHHLYLNNQLGFDQIAELISIYCIRFAIVEFIPKSDKKVQILLQNKTLDFTGYNEDNFTNALSEWFTINEVVTLEDSERKLLLLEKIK